MNDASYRHTKRPDNIIDATELFRPKPKSVMDDEQFQKFLRQMGWDDDEK